VSTRALAATGEQIVAADTYVSSALAQPVQAFLPPVNDGSGTSVAVDAEIRVETTAGGPVELLTAGGRRVGIVPPRSQALVVARSGLVQAEADSWNFELHTQTPAAFNAAAPAGGTGATAGAYDTAANRNALIDLVNAMRTALINAGLMKAE
jgi:hypothetical protein